MPNPKYNLSPIGTRFGKLTIISSPTKVAASGQLFWAYECKCDCGRTLMVNARNMTIGLSRSCGCGHIRFPKLRDVEWLSNRLRETTVINIAHELGCSPCTVRSYIIRNNIEPPPRYAHPKKLRYSLTGMQFGLLTVIGPPNRDDRTPKWECLCRCGKKVYVTTNLLVRGTRDGDSGKRNGTRGCRSCSSKGRIRRPLSEEAKKKIGDAHRGKSGPNQTRFWKGKKFSIETRERLSRSHKGKQTGPSHPNWKGGVTSIRSKAMGSFEVRLWISKVYERDDYTCLKCGSRGAKLNAHHVRNWADNREFRLDVDNGATLCRACHHEFHRRYGYRNTTREQFSEFIG